MEALHTWSARRIAAAVRARELSAEEVTRHHLDRIAEHEHLHTVITLTGDSALACARQGPLGSLHLLRPSRDGFDHRLLIREFTRLELGVEQFSVHSQLKTASTRRN